MPARTVLIVDDSESICNVLAFLLEKEGYVTHSAYDGERGVEMAREHHPDVILLDIMMPELDGWGVVRRLKGDRETADIPVLALTALRLTDEHVSAAGFEGYLSKPVSTHRLKEEIQRVCGQPR